jgi:HK97 family phage portal protein
MSFLGKLFRKSSSSRREITTPSQLAAAIGLSNISESGMTVSLETAMGVVSVLACARVYAKGTAQVPLKLFKPTPDGGKTAETTGLGRLLYRQPNKFQTAYRFRHMIGMHLALTGKFAAYVNRVGDEIIELLPVHPSMFEVEGTSWRPTYKMFLDGGWRQVPPEKVLYIQGDTMDGVTTMPVTQYARDAIGLTMATDTHASKFFQNGGAASGHYTTDIPDLSETERQSLIDTLQQMEERQNSAFRKTILWGGLKYEHTSYAPEQAQLKEIRDQQVEEICRAFGVNPAMIGYQGGKTATFASLEQLLIMHVVYTLGPWYEMIEQELDRQLLTDAQKDAGYEFKHVVQGLMRGAYKDRVAGMVQLRNAKIITANEARALEDMNPIDGGDMLWSPNDSDATQQETNSGESE